ncbi:MAG TPA: DnaJ domain-containing protein [Bacteroidia bacterium]|nr:DnaJ domain-containing protein [Bacteroidia bacterium]
MNVDCYRLLGIGPGADEKEIRKAWRLRSKDVHPDVNASADAAKKFRELTDAMNLLLDPAERIKHDRQFGYFSKPKNQDANAKESFSEFQEEKAEHLVNAWNEDYEKAMQMREQQRREVIEKHRGRLKRILISTLLFIVFLSALLIAMWYKNML